MLTSRNAKQKSQNGRLLSAGCVANVDEFLLNVTGAKLGTRRLTVQRRQYNMRGSRPSTVGSIVAVTSADGKLLFSALILKPSPSKVKGTAVDGKQMFRTSFVPDAKAAQSWGKRHKFEPDVIVYRSSGCVDGNAWKNIAASFIEHTRLHHSGREFMLLLDNLAAHLELTAVSALLNNNVRCLYLPKNTSHFTQPNDDKIFGNLRRLINRKINRIGMAKNWFAQATWCEIVLDAYAEARLTAFSETVIRASYRDTGQYPWNPELIRRRAKEAAGAMPAEVTDRPVVEQWALAVTHHTLRRYSQRPTTDPTFATQVVANQIYKAEEVVSTKQKQMGEAATAAAEKLARRVQRENLALRKAAPAEAWLCQHPNCKHKWTRTTDLDWEECEKCNLHLICCEHPGAKELMVAHEMTCDGNFKSSKVPHRPGAGKRKRGRKPAVAAAGDKTPSATYEDEDGENDEKAHDDNDSDESDEQPTLARQFAAIATERAPLPPRKRRKTVFKISAPKKHK